MLKSCWLSSKRSKNDDMLLLSLKIEGKDPAEKGVAKNVEVLRAAFR